MLRFYSLIKKDRLIELEKEVIFNELNVALICLEDLATLCNLNANKAN